MKTMWLRLVGSGCALFMAGLAPLEAGQWDTPDSVAWNNSAWAEQPYVAAAPKAAAPAPQAAAPAPQPAAPAEAAAANECCETSGSCGNCCDPWKLPQPCIFQQHGITVGGWAQAGVYTNAHGAPTNGPLGLNNLTDFNLHQGWIYAEKKTNTEDYCWDLGGRVDYVFGVDGPDTQAFGDQSWDFDWNSSSRYGSAIPQLYLELAFGDWSIKGGHFYTPIGYEVVPATGNFFYSHSYTFYYAEPFTHTGFLVNRKIGEKLNVFGGWVDGWDSGFENRNAADNFLGGFNLALSERATFAWSLTTGNWGSGAIANAGDIYMNSFVLTYKLTERWTYIFQHDLGLNNNNPGGDSQWYGINQYLLCQLNDCWAAGLRFEWFHDDDGTRVVPGNAGDYYEITLGLNYKPHPNLVVRPEIRWDWYEGDLASGHHPYGNNDANSQFAGGFDVIFTF